MLTYVGENGRYEDIFLSKMSLVLPSKLIGWVEQNDLNRLQSKNQFNPIVIKVYGTATSGRWNGSPDATKIISYLSTRTSFTVDISSFATYGNDGRIYIKISIP